MWPFREKTFLPPEYMEWQFQTYAWLFRNFEGFDRFKQTRLVTPTAEFFPATELKGHDFVQFMFERVRELGEMSDWTCTLEAQDEQLPPIEVQPGVGLVNLDHAPSGTFSFPSEAGAGATITYDPALENHPADLVATFAHELGHYLTGTAQEEPPAGWEAWELVTDLAAVFLGFGIFSVNSAFSFHQFGDSTSIGWRSRQQGYLSRPSLLFALAIFVRLTETDEKLACAHLKPELIKPFRNALADVDSHPLRLGELRNVRPRESTIAEA